MVRENYEKALVICGTVRTRIEQGENTTRAWKEKGASTVRKWNEHGARRLRAQYGHERQVASTVGTWKSSVCAQYEHGTNRVGLE
jgi:ferredoxin